MILPHEIHGLLSLSFVLLYYLCSQDEASGIVYIGNDGARGSGHGLWRPCAL